MKTAEEWAKEFEQQFQWIDWNKQLRSMQKRTDSIRAIQLDAIKACAEVVRTFSDDHKCIQPSFTGLRDAILNLAKEVEGK